jgi:hypothetical protein
MKSPPVTTYHHTQAGPWGLVLIAFGLLMVGISWFARREPVVLVICPATGALFLVLAAMFHDLTVSDEGDHLTVRFGPLPVARRTIFYADVREVEVGRTLVMDGWGIHMSVRGGWVWNVWGRDCVIISLERSVLRVGTDDAAELAAFLKARIGRA